MPTGVPGFAQYVPGRDTPLNATRRQSVRAVTVHRTQGNDSRGLGATRRHASPGTFNFLVRDEALYCYYPADVRCSHAAGSNWSGPGIEIEGFTGQPISAKQKEHLDSLTMWLTDTYGVPHDLYDGPRIQIDGSTFRGFVNHNSVQTAPEYRHTDRIPPKEFTVKVDLTLAAAVGISNTIDNALDKKLKPLIEKLNEIDKEVDALTELAKQFKP